MAESFLRYAPPVLLYPEGYAEQERPWSGQSGDYGDVDDIDDVDDYGGGGGGFDDTRQQGTAHSDARTVRRAAELRKGWRRPAGTGKGAGTTTSLRSAYAPEHPISRAARSPSPIRVRETAAPRHVAPQKVASHVPSRPPARPHSRSRVRPPSSSMSKRLVSTAPAPRFGSSEAPYLSKHRETQMADVGTTSRTGRILELLLPSRKWAQDDASLGAETAFSEEGLEAKPHYHQRVSTAPPSRKEVESMAVEFDAALEKVGARPKPGNICPAREKLFSELFDEVLRQVTLEMPERGILLLRVRNEVKLRILTMLAIQDYASGYGTIGAADESAIRDLEAQHAALDADVTRLRQDKATRERRLALVTDKEMRATELFLMALEDERQGLVLQKDRFVAVLKATQLDIERGRVAAAELRASKKKKKRLSIKHTTTTTTTTTAAAAPCAVEGTSAS